MEETPFKVKDMVGFDWNSRDTIQRGGRWIKVFRQY